MKRSILHCLLLLSLWGGGMGVPGQSWAENAELKEADLKQSEPTEAPAPSSSTPASETTPTTSQKSMEERSLESRGVLAIPDPKFITEGSSARTQGVYFGVGFRQVRLDFRTGRSIVNNDGALNGVAFNLGFFTETQVWEYTRHVTILDLNETLDFKDRLFNFVEVIQNSIWYFRSARLIQDLYANYGVGVQSSEVRLILKIPQTPSEDTTNLEGSTELHREDSLLWGGGGTYFITPDFFIQYRLTQGNYSPLITGPNVDNALHATQIHTLFLQYYFSL